MTPGDTDDLTAGEAEVLRVLKGQVSTLDRIGSELAAGNATLDTRIAESEGLLEKLGVQAPAAPVASRNRRTALRQPRTWDDLVAEATESDSGAVTFKDVLAQEDIDAALAELADWNEEFAGFHRLDGIDWIIAGSAGLLAALADAFLVGIPKHAGLLGGQASEGGPLSNLIRQRLRDATPPDELARLEKELWVPYDPSTSKRLLRPVAGLGPRTHRFQSLGHWPILGFVFGVRDILCGEFTAIDRSGVLIRQKVEIRDPASVGMTLFGAIGRVYGHNFRTDLPTAQGLPAPLMGLFQFLQVGEIGDRGRTIGEVSRLMYLQHYDFGHFLAMSVPVLLIEVMVRLGYLLKRMHEGCSLAEALPVGESDRSRKPKLATMLWVAHLVATLGNAGKIAVTSTPLAISYPQWVAFFKYSLQQLAWALHGRERERTRFVQDRLDAHWADLNADFAATLGSAFGPTVRLGDP